MMKVVHFTNRTTLSQLILKQEYQLAINHLKHYPEESAVWIVDDENNDDEEELHNNSNNETLSSQTQHEQQRKKRKLVLVDEIHGILLWNVVIIIK